MFNISKVLILLIIMQFSWFLPSLSDTVKLKILITGFEPFGVYKTNPSEELINFINSKSSDKLSDDFIIKGIIIPVSYYESWNILSLYIDKFKPDIVISLGYAPNSNSIRIESTAKNKDEGFEDNKGISHYGAIIPNGVSSYNSALPIIKIQKSLNENNIKAYISNDAGGFICNHIFYNLMHHVGIDPKIKAGFIHIPSWSTERLWEFIKIVIDTVSSNSIKVNVFEFEPIEDDVNQNLLRINNLIL